jgi:hypothetical protein
VCRELLIVARNRQSRQPCSATRPSLPFVSMKDLLLLLAHLLSTIAKLLGPGGAKTVVAQSLLMKQQLLIVNRSRRRAPRPSAFDRFQLGFWPLFLGNATSSAPPSSFDHRHFSSFTPSSRSENIGCSIRLPVEQNQDPKVRHPKRCPKPRFLSTCNAMGNRPRNVGEHFSRTTRRSLPQSISFRCPPQPSGSCTCVWRIRSHAAIGSETVRRTDVARCNVRTKRACESINPRGDRAQYRQATDARDAHCNNLGMPPTYLSTRLSSKRTSDRDIRVEPFRSVARRTDVTPLASSSKPATPSQAETQEKIKEGAPFHP